MLSKAPHDVLKVKVTQLGAYYTISRADGSSDSDGSYGTQRNFTEIGERRLYLYTVSDRRESRGVGEVADIRLEGYCLPKTDIAEDDRVEFDGQTFEIETKRPLPIESDPQLYRLTAELVT